VEVPDHTSSDEITEAFTDNDYAEADPGVAPKHKKGRKGKMRKRLTSAQKREKKVQKKEKLANKKLEKLDEGV